MALSVSELLDQVQLDLQDDGTRWPREDLLEYFNAGQRALAELRPDQVSEQRDLKLAAGWQQSLPHGAVALMDVLHGVGERAERITRVDERVLSSIKPRWRSGRMALAVTHYMYDLREPYTFLVYPPVEDGVEVRAQLAFMPADLAQESDPAGVPERWMDALGHFVLHRAWAKDGEFAANATLAAAHLQLFMDALGMQAQTAAAATTE